MSLSQWTKQFTRFGRDGYHLATAIIQDTTAKRAVSFKPVLLQHARQSNAVANSLLQMDKQVGLVRYYGVMGYVKQRWQPALKGEDADKSSLSFSTSATATTTTSTTGTARVAFMITASMKEELADKLGYDIDQVKQMTPLQASLVLHHQITPDVFEEQLPIAEQEYEVQRVEEQRQRELEIKEKEKLHQEMELKKKQEQLKRQEEEQQQQQQQGQQQEPVEQQQHQQVVAIEGGTSFSQQLGIRAFSGENAFGYHSPNLLLSPESDPENEFSSFWFEVIETNNETDEISRVGLYNDEQEALIGLETRQDIAQRKGRPLEFEMRPVDRTSLFSK
jgi:hypothetical protein